MSDDIQVKDGSGNPVTLAFSDDGSRKTPRGIRRPSGAQLDAIAPVSSIVAEAGHVLKNAPGNFYGGYATVPSAGYLMVLNVAAIPADGAVTPVECLYCPGPGTYSIDNSEMPDYYGTGVVMVFSSTGPFTKTGITGCFFKGRVV